MLMRMDLWKLQRNGINSSLKQSRKRFVICKPMIKKWSSLVKLTHVSTYSRSNSLAKKIHLSNTKDSARLIKMISKIFRFTYMVTSYHGSMTNVLRAKSSWVSDLFRPGNATGMLKVMTMILSTKESSMKMTSLVGLALQ